MSTKSLCSTAIVCIYICELMNQLVEARYYSYFDEELVKCALCPFNCRIANGKRGVCGIRENRDNTLYALTYGNITSRALDPIEKKPLYHYFPGRPVLSIGEWGCNLKCQYCQNSAISQFEAPTEFLRPDDVAALCRDHNSVGVAYTYNEPLVAYEYIYDCAQAVRKAGGKNILVTNGYINPEPLAALLPYIDAMNIDIKAFNQDFYSRYCKATLAPVLETVKASVPKTHVELTTLLIPEANDAIPELNDLAVWIRENCGIETPAHLTAYFPSYQMRAAATTSAHLANAWKIFKKHLYYVYTGNLPTPGGSDTICRHCGAAVIKRKAFAVDVSGMNHDGACANCGAENNIIVT